MRLQIFIAISLIVIFKNVDAKMTIEEIKKFLVPMKNSCMKKFTIDEALVDGTTNGEFPEDENLMCFMKCMLTMMKMIKNGEILLTAIFTQVDLMIPDELTDKLKEVLTQCHGQVEPIEQQCEKAFEFAKCLYMADSELYFFF
uniref:Odorant-binding protein 9 n=1 Tax=Encarsia formosa TaxID=32400 RepID=A0A514TTW5_ENCFO|nr:odorant-binding protein 9 [Encarsia formosa]